MVDVIGVLFAAILGMIAWPQIQESQAIARHTQVVITTAQEQQQWVSAVNAYVNQNSAALETSATSTTPVTLTVPMVQAANVGLPATFAPVNPFNQTWVAQVLQPSAGDLQVLAFGSGGNVLNDTELGDIARAAAGAGGFVPTNNSGVYPGGSAFGYGTLGYWKISTAGYSIGAGGVPASLLTYSNGTLSSNYLYRNLVPGQPQLNDMNTSLGMNNNNITNVGQLQANTGTGVVIGNSNFYGDANDTAIRQNGTLYVQNQAGTAPGPINSGTVTVAGDADVSGNVTVGGDVGATGAVTSGGLLTAQGQIQINGTAVEGTACPDTGRVVQNGSGLLLSCQSGVWTRQSSGSTTFFMVPTFGGGCVTPNPATGSCSCPSGTQYLSLSGQASSNGYAFDRSIYACVP